MADVAPEIDCTTLEIILTDAIYRRGISVRQAVVDDPGNRMDSHLIIVVDGPIPSEALTAIKQCKGVASLILR
jgi:predicted regulator of amino acid metabolism with ACT domain